MPASLQDVEFKGDSMTARFTRKSPTGSISRGILEPLVFDASPSSDPSDPSNAAQAMRCVCVCMCVSKRLCLLGFAWVWSREQMERQITV